MADTTSRRAPFKCGFCSTSDHDRCPRAVRNGDGSPVLCTCTTEHAATEVRCLDCRNTRSADVSSTTWRCFDPDACKSRVQARLDANPTIQLIRRHEENAMTETATAPKPAKVAKTGTCLVTGEPTKGGKFKPGMDARYVSMKVQAVLEGKISEDDATKAMRKDEVSDTLVAKFEKALGLARAKAEKLAAAATAKAEKESAASPDADAA